MFVLYSSLTFYLNRAFLAIASPPYPSPMLNIGACRASKSSPTTKNRNSEEFLPQYMKNFLLQNVGSSRYFFGSLAVFEERGEPANYGARFSPPAAAKNVRAILRIVHIISSRTTKLNTFVRCLNGLDRID